MPIRPENAARYPADWPKIRERILLRAGNCCEGSPAFPECRIPNHWYRDKLTGHTVRPQDVGVIGGELTRVVLTIGHLDHTPENCADDNLRAWCQRCHLSYDAEHHARTAYATRRQGKTLAELFPT